MFVFVNVAKFNFVHIMYKKKQCFGSRTRFRGFRIQGIKKRFKMLYHQKITKVVSKTRKIQVYFFWRENLKSLQKCTLPEVQHKVVLAWIRIQILAGSGFNEHGSETHRKHCLTLPHWAGGSLSEESCLKTSAGSPWHRNRSSRSKKCLQGRTRYGTRSLRKLL